VRELGEIDMVSRALATLDLLTHDARPVFPAVHLEGHAVLSYGELAGLAGGSGWVLRLGGKALVLCAGDRDLPALYVWRASQDAVRDWRASPCTGPVDVFGLPWPCWRPLSSAGTSAVRTGIWPARCAS
jgi:hypothetical protein